MTDPFSVSRELQFRLFIGQNLSKNGNSHSLSSRAWEYTQSHLGQIGPLLACKAQFIMLHFEKKVCVKRTFPLEVISIASLEIHSILVPWKAYIGPPGFPRILHDRSFLSVSRASISTFYRPKSEQKWQLLNKQTTNKRPF